MSDLPSETELRTPMPRRGLDTGYFDDELTDSAFGVTSLCSSTEANDMSASHTTDVDAKLLAQQELVSRALSPTAAGTRHSSPANSCSGRIGRNNVEVLPPISESIASSRPGTPLSVPSFLPLPSNPSSNPGETQPMSPGPKLVMPSMQMSPRRPYTENGRKIGKLRIAFCGDSGSGKTTLLRTIADMHADIVHCENTQGSEPGRTTTEINEVRASSQPYPPWRILSATASAHSDAVMERNICLIDTPGYALSAEADDAISPIMHYVQAQFQKVNEVVRENAQLNDEDFMSLISAPQGGLTQLDVAIYCLTKVLSDIDMTFIHNLSQFTTVIPVITKCDISSSDAEALQSTIHSQLTAINFSFFKPCAQSSSQESVPLRQPYLISCIDPEIEASIMMRDDYTPGLYASDLPHLLTTLFTDPHPARLRHDTARKFMSWKIRQQTQQALIHLPIDHERMLLPSAEFTTGRIAAHTAAEDKKTRLRIAAWAHEMRQSFAVTPLCDTQDPSSSSAAFSTTTTGGNEKSASWLLTRMNDYVEHEKRQQGKRRAGERYHLKYERDPFGLLRLRERWSRRLKRTFKWLCDVSFTSCGLLLLYHLWDRVNVME